MAKITTTQEVPDLFTIIEAAKLIGISQSSLYGYIRAGKVETVKIGRQRFLTHGEITWWKKQMNSQTASSANTIAVRVVEAK